MITELTAGRRGHPDLITRMLTRVIKGSARRMLRWKPIGSVLLELPNSQRLRFGAPSGSSEPFLKLHNYKVIPKSLRRGANGFADAYLDGDIECSDLTGLFRFFARNRDRMDETGGSLFKARMPDRVAHLTRANTRAGSRRNISEHYDLGNDFYRLWLDTEMNYSSGLYLRKYHSLEQAQQAKLDLVLDMLDLRGGEKILEIGCGWGAFARRAAATDKAGVTGVTLSHEQLAWARERADADSFGTQCEFRLQDYRDVEGQYDRIVSVEMIEAVGEENWPRYFGVLYDRLKPGGCAVIQSITIEEKRFRKYRRKADFIQRYIFPGGMLPTRTLIESHATRAGLVLTAVESFGESYARTLEDWRLRFEASWPEIAELGFDERFRRKWNYYLTYCEAGFLEGVIDVSIYRLGRA